MNDSLVRIISNQVDIFLHNVNTTVNTCDMNYVLFDAPIWKHVYHMLHSLDKWFINPSCFCEPSIHEPDLNDIDIRSDNSLTQEQLQDYFDEISARTRKYISTLNDDMLKEKPSGCDFSRLALILGQFRHLYSHLGNINATTMMQRGKWPKVVGLDANMNAGLFE